MRRSRIAAVAIVLVSLFAADVAVNGYPARQSPGAAYDRLADDLGRIVVSPNSSPTNKYANSCAPAQVAACDQIVLSVVGVVVHAAAYPTIQFVVGDTTN